MDERQTDVIGEHHDLADARAHRSAPARIVIYNSIAPQFLHRLWSNLCYKVAQFQGNLEQRFRQVIEMGFKLAQGQHKIKPGKPPDDEYFTISLMIIA